ncbi:hypothetical protein B9Z55_001894 [Caenorhabditis nigoni]|uniref:Uncharacterized protein n=1 Tax=Caenorhabditis nigoni TaxID=1611254 RepID=A0A2G5VHR6_9PELO|nr:hypothetical protein B9Z55_001894 [Caenorhabditis nigoni]
MLQCCNNTCVACLDSGKQKKKKEFWQLALERLFPFKKPPPHTYNYTWEKKKKDKRDSGSSFTRIFNHYEKKKGDEKREDKRAKIIGNILKRIL